MSSGYRSLGLSKPSSTGVAHVDSGVYGIAARQMVLGKAILVQLRGGTWVTCDEDCAKPSDSQLADDERKAILPRTGDGLTA